MTPEWIGAIIAFLMLLGGLAIHIGFSIWWASKITTTLDFVKKSSEDTSTDLKLIKETYAKKEDLRAIEKNYTAMWNKIDKIQRVLGHIDTMEPKKEDDT